MLTNELKAAQTKADTTRHAAEEVLTENSQLHEHIHLLESELSSLQHDAAGSGMLMPENLIGSGFSRSVSEDGGRRSEVRSCD